jgi:hypothetical protein
MITALAFALATSVAIPADPEFVATITRSGTPTDPNSLLVELVKALAWPIVTLVVAAIFRRSLGTFLTALGSRITKLSLFKVELELVPAKPASAVPLFDDIRSAANAAEISDSSNMMLEQVQSGTPADYAEIALGTGEDWIISRLYIAAVMMERMRGLRCFVFVERASMTERRFVAIATVAQVRWALACKFQWLEAAWLNAVRSAFPHLFGDSKTLSSKPPIFRSDTGAFEPYQARTLVSIFIASLQKPIDVAPNAVVDPVPVADAGWVVLKNQTQERASFVTRELLKSLLSPDAFRPYTDALSGAPRAQRTRAVLRVASPFVALVDVQRDFELVRVVNRHALLEEVASSLADEPEAN